MTRDVCHITFSGMDPVEAAKIEVRAWFERLSALTARMTLGKVVIEAVDERRQERMYRVRMELAMPGGVVVVGPDHPSNLAHSDVYVAIRNAFRAARRLLEIHSQLEVTANGVAATSDGGADVASETQEPAAGAPAAAPGLPAESSSGEDHGVDNQRPYQAGNAAGSTGTPTFYSGTNR